MLREFRLFIETFGRTLLPLFEIFLHPIFQVITKMETENEGKSLHESLQQINENILSLLDKSFFPIIYAIKDDYDNFNQKTIDDLSYDELVIMLKDKEKKFIE